MATPFVEMARERLRQLFKFLAEYALRNQPYVTDYRRQLWHLRLDMLPTHTSIVVAAVREADSGGAAAAQLGGAEGALLLVRRPKLTMPPEPPEVLAGWVLDGWQEADGEPKAIEARNVGLPGGGSQSERFSADAQRDESFELWRQAWLSWRERERPALDAHRVYDELYTLHAQIRRDSESLELVVADGLLSVASTSANTCHPIHLLRVEIEFDAASDPPVIRVEQADREPELLGRVLLAAGDRAEQALPELRADLANNWYHPLEGERTSGFYRKVAQSLHADGKFIGSPSAESPTQAPVIARCPMLMLRRRDAGLHQAFERVQEDLASTPEVPVALSRLVGIDVPLEPEAELGTPGPWGEPVDILLSKPANQEQIRIARAIDRHRAVLVQGPPGTGKTHTIANLIGHLIAQGKRVLVTSHTTKALRVLKSKVERSLQPLCLSVLDSDSDSRKQMEDSVRDILSRLTTDDPKQLEAEALALERQRLDLVERIEKTTSLIREARSGQYRELVYLGEALSPSEAAKWLAAHDLEHSWIPRPVVPNAACPLGETELSRLYELNGLVPKSDAEALALGVPDPSTLPSAEAFQAWARARVALPDALWERLWSRPAAAHHVPALEALQRWAATAVNEVETFSVVESAVVSAGAVSDEEAQLWFELCTRIERLHSAWQTSRQELLDHEVCCAAGEPRELAEKHIDQMIEHVRRGGSFDWVTNLLHGEWKRTRLAIRVNGGMPTTDRDLSAVRTWLNLEAERAKLRLRWQAQAVPVGYPTWSDLGHAPEQRLKELADECLDNLVWFSKHREAFSLRTSAVGFELAAADSLVGVLDKRVAPLKRELSLLREVLLPACENQLALAYRAQAAQGRQSLISKLEAYSTRLVLQLRGCLHRWDADSYGSHYEELVRIWGLRQLVAEREELLQRLAASAPGWAAAVRRREGLHGQPFSPGSIAVAWRWIQLHEVLLSRESLDEAELAVRLRRHCSELRELTTGLIDKKGWLAQARRTTLNSRQALQGWSDTVRRIGKGTGKRAPELQRKAQELLVEAREAVPVWIMPFSRVVESINPASGRFDVVVIDEASQADLTALLTWYVGDRVVVVGDHEQVSPMAVGENVDDIKALQVEYLADIPNRNLYDGRLSVYDLARQCFGGTIALREHFRCVPDIIEFSNGLAYDFRIEPLRNPDGVPVPHVAEFVVPGGVRSAGMKTNPEEVRAVVALMKAMLKDPDYSTSTFGAISLLGDEQATAIQELALRELGSAELERRDFLAGNAAQFQGDERNVMFLSMVDSPSEGPLTLAAREETKQRYNVAASRAQDQLWLIHSLDPSSDLKPGDIRRRLIEHVRNPRALRELVAAANSRAESPFEAEVQARLIAAGYRIRPQVQVGSYRIDIVVEGAVALECDGDRFHPSEKLAADLERQAILERAGWPFVRIRGTQFYRNPDGVMGVAFRQLTSLGVRPTGGLEADTEVETHARAKREALVRQAQDFLNEKGWRGDSAQRSGRHPLGSLFAALDE